MIINVILFYNCFAKYHIIAFSIPAGCTKKDNTKPLKISGFYFNRASKERPNQNKITLIIPNCRIIIWRINSWYFPFYRYSLQLIFFWDNLWNRFFSVFILSTNRRLKIFFFLHTYLTTEITQRSFYRYIFFLFRLWP